ncbi:MAG TPA: acetyl-CoA C-acyltransferase [Phycisphaerales bacterium]|nr:acetyl-CoA C-acyltransferase [Phycisphaerales bacterium]HMP37282.1 acetyl-CoA C-acyltransferase [Phycisphaerales bacterium]
MSNQPRPSGVSIVSGRAPRRAAVIAGRRTPFGRHGGALASVRPDDLAAHAISAVLAESGIDPALVQEVVLGAANQSGEDNRNVARMAALLAGLPVSVAGVTVNRLCASGLEAVATAARMIESGCAEIVVAGGVESMSRAPYVLSKADQAFGRAQELHDTTIGWRLINPRLAGLHHPFSMGETAENVARANAVTRAEQDRFALESQRRWAAAHAAGRFAAELAPIDVPQGRRPPLRFDTDEHPRPETTLEQLSALRPVFAADGTGTVTAGNSSGINDGAAALLLVEASRAEALGLTPLAFVGPAAAVGVDPSVMGIGPVPAIRTLLHRAGIALPEIDLFEVNEAFAAQGVACIRELGLDADRVNVNGGAIAIGHPLGASGARLAATLVHEMVRRDARLGVASLCVGVGQGMAALFERS